jgi:hypothetical protein
MTEQPRGGLHFHISKLLVAAVIMATAATGALIIAILIDMPPSTPPPPGPNGLPPPPPPMQPLAVFPIVTGFFVLSWLAVLVVFSRDQILQHLRQQAAPAVSRDELRAALADLRAEVAGDREREIGALGDRLAELTTEYGEHRETDGYLNGMRTAAANDPPEPNVRAFRRNPPQR